MFDDIESHIREFCQHHHIRKLAVFGSILREDFNASSDVDVLVEFETGHAPGWEFIEMEEELSSLIGRDVDLNTPGFLSDTFRDDVLSEAIILYERER